VTTTLRNIHRLMTARQSVLLADGRSGKIVRVDTVFPANDTVVSVWVDSGEPSPESGRRHEIGPGVAKVSLADVVGPARDGKSSG
jgi:hypothetical protein